MSKASTNHIDQVLDVVEGLGGPSTEEVIRKSWVRSANAHGVDPGSNDAPFILTNIELRHSQDAAAQLIDVARTELDYLYKIVRPAGYVILLCDKNGLVIEHRGQEAEASRFRRWGTWLGGIWSEAAEGTNGIGTCLVEGVPVTVHRSQHFRARHINLSCSGAPIFDGDGELLGILDVSSIDPALSERSHALTGALTIATARAIEERLFRKRFCRAWIVATEPVDGTESPMLIAVDQDFRVLGADRFARKVFRRSGQRLPVENLSLWSIFERNETPFRHPDRGDARDEFSPLGSEDMWPAIVTPPAPALGGWSPPANEELRLRPRLDTLALVGHKSDQARGGLPPVTLHRIREYVDSHLDQTIDLEALAAVAGLSVYHFARSFKQSEGTTPHAYVLERRVARARKLLTSTSLPQSEIALEVGFADQSHFARRFRQTVGVSPGAFRKL
jgi:AraC-like DNA-binding protein